MALIKIKTKYQVTLPTAIRQKAGLSVGDLLEVKLEKGKITLTPKTILDRGIAEGMADFAAGRVHGPFDSAEAMELHLRRQLRKLKKASRRP